MRPHQDFFPTLNLFNQNSRLSSQYQRLHHRTFVLFSVCACGNHFIRSCKSVIVPLNHDLVCRDAQFYRSPLLSSRCSVHIKPHRYITVTKTPKYKVSVQYLSAVDELKQLVSHRFTPTSRSRNPSGYRPRASIDAFGPLIANEIGF